MSDSADPALPANRARPPQIPKKEQRIVGTTIIGRIERGVRTVGAVDIAITEIVWSDGARSFEACLPDGTDITEDGCFDEAPSHQQLRDLLHTWVGPGSWVCPGCGCRVEDSQADMVVDHVRDCDLLDGAGQPVTPDPGTRAVPERRHLGPATVLVARAGPASAVADLLEHLTVGVEPDLATAVGAALRAVLSLCDEHRATGNRSVPVLDLDDAIGRHLRPPLAHPDATIEASRRTEAAR